MITEAQALRLAAVHIFRPFDEADWEAYAGCLSESPLICEAPGFVMILDDSTLSYIDNGGEELKFHLLQQEQ